jgi:signal transduction histidine kinase
VRRRRRSYTEVMTSRGSPERGNGPRARVFDLVLAVLVWGSVSWLITADQAGDRAPDALAYLWALGLGCLMLVRRRYPLLVLWITVAALFGYYTAGYPAVGLSVPAAGALLTAAEFRRLRWPLLASALLLTVSYGARTLQGQDLTRIIGYELVGHLGLMAAAIALGTSMRLRRELQERTAQLVRAVREKECREVQAALAAERTAIARDLHDSLGHRLAVLSLHTEVAAEAADASAARSALAVIRETADAMSAELHRTVRALRRSEDGQGAVRSPRSLAGLESLFAALPVETHVTMDGALRTGAVRLPAPVEAAAVRIVQEALTNVVRHSLATRARVTITLGSGSGSGTEAEAETEIGIEAGTGSRTEAGDGGATETRSGSAPEGVERLHLVIADPGPPRRESLADRPEPRDSIPRRAAEDGLGGLGLLGMRERAEALGGCLEAGPRALADADRAGPDDASPDGTGPDSASPDGASPDSAGPGDAARSQRDPLARGFVVEARLPLGADGGEEEHT